MDAGGDVGIAAPDGLISIQMALVQLLAVLRGYLRCMPEAFAEARVDLIRLLPEV